MGIVIKGDLYRDLDEQLYEIKGQINQKSGYPYDPEALWNHLKAAINGQFDTYGQATVFRQDMFEFKKDMRDASNGGLTIEKHITRRITSVSDLEIVSVLKRGEVCIDDFEFFERARELKANYGQEDAEYILDRHNEIPKKFRKYLLVFPGTIWYKPNTAIEKVPCLKFEDRSWDLSLFLLGSGFYSGCRLVRPRKLFV